MLTTAVNVVAFYLGALSFGSSHSLVGVLVFMATALVGTILSTLFEVYMRSLLPVQRPVRVRSRQSRSSRHGG
jgi:hypothetical protein